MRSVIALAEVLTLCEQLESQGYDPATVAAFRALATERRTQIQQRRREFRQREASHGTTTPVGRRRYGYLYVVGGITILDEEAEVVRRIVAWHAEQKSLHAIAAQLNATAIPAPYGGARWYASSVREILHREADYRGGPRGTEGQRWPAILPPETASEVNGAAESATLPWEIAPTVVDESLSPGAATTIFQLRIALVDVAPEIWRRLLVRADTPLAHFVRILTLVMGWPLGEPFALLDATTQDSYQVGQWDEWGEDISGNGTWQGQMRLYEILWQDGPDLQFWYGRHQWQHTLVVEAEEPLKPRATYPRVMEGRRACPPVTCEDSWEYRQYLAALQAPRRQSSRSYLQKYGRHFDPTAFVVGDLNAQLRDQGGGGKRP